MAPSGAGKNRGMVSRYSRRQGEPVVTRAPRCPVIPPIRMPLHRGSRHGVLIATLYAPNGNPQPGPKFKYKLAWMKRLLAHAAEALRPQCAGRARGDYNVVPTDADIYQPSHTLRMHLYNQSHAPYFGFSIRAGSMRSARCIFDAPMYTFWDYKRNRGNAMPAFASIICC